MRTGKYAQSHPLSLSHTHLHLHIETTVRQVQKLSKSFCPHNKCGFLSSVAHFLHVQLKCTQQIEEETRWWDTVGGHLSAVAPSVWWRSLFQAASRITSSVNVHLVVVNMIQQQRSKPNVPLFFRIHWFASPNMPNLISFIPGWIFHLQ